MSSAAAAAVYFERALIFERARKQMRAVKAAKQWEVEAEERLNNRLSRLFRDVERQVMEHFDRVGVPSNPLMRRRVTEPLEQIGDAVAEEMASVTQEGAVFGKERMVVELQQQGMSISFSQPNPRVAEEIAQHAFEASQATMARVIGDVTDVLLKSYLAGLGQDATAVALREVFDGLTDSKLRNIARTEINGAQNLASYRALQEIGVHYHRWNATLDGRTRPSHMAQNGMIARLGDPYPNGLRYPGDRSGPIKEWVGCRCRVSAFLMPVGYTAPPTRRAFTRSQLVKVKPVTPAKVRSL